MAVHIHNITFDCTDAHALAGFWSRLTGWNVYHDDDPEVVVAPTFPHAGTGLLFIPVPEGKTAKNRVHLDLSPETGTRDEAVEAAVADGATVIGDHRTPDGMGWVTLADPEGNEFCLERGVAERAPRSRAASGSAPDPGPGRTMHGVWSRRLARSSVVLVVLAGVISVLSGLLALAWSPDLPPAPPDTCTAEPCFNLNVGNSSPFAVLPLIAHVLLLGSALAVGGLIFLLGVVTAIRRRRFRALAVGAMFVAGPLMVLAGGEVLPHVLNPCVLPDLAGAEPPAFCESTSEGADVPENWHALDHALVGFLPLSLLVAWWWRRQVHRTGVGDRDGLA